MEINQLNFWAKLGEGTMKKWNKLETNGFWKSTFSYLSLSFRFMDEFLIIHITSLSFLSLIREYFLSFQLISISIIIANSLLRYSERDTLLEEKSKRYNLRDH
jgi:hypothetical protein